MIRANKIKIGLVALIYLLLISTIILIIYVKFEPIPESAEYVGSETCEGCHSSEHEKWEDSLHAKMMRPIEDVKVVANTSPESDVPFDPSDIHWVIGSKWEQQFMGAETIDGHTTETLLPGAWMIDKQEWMLQGWDGWQVPVPVERCHGCHSVGLNVETGEFAEPSIGCESCHGPGSWHVKTKGMGRIHNSIDATMCGQCHTRGKSVNGKHFFPVEFRPYENLEAVFNESKPDPLQNTSHWWANGHARKRHQEYFSWKQGGHSHSLTSLTENYDGRFGDVSSECLTCHAGEAAVLGPRHGLSLDDVGEGITCSVCHQAHGELHEARMTCDQCHGKSAYYHDQSKNSNHIACPETAKVQCVDCHMPKTGWNGGDYTLHSHTAGIIPPEDTVKWGVPNSCANGGCHEKTDQNVLESMYQTHYTAH